MHLSLQKTRDLTRRVETLCTRNGGDQELHFKFEDYLLNQSIPIFLELLLKPLQSVNEPEVFYKCV